MGNNNNVNHLGTPKVEAPRKAVCCHSVSLSKWVPNADLEGASNFACHVAWTNAEQQHSDLQNSKACTGGRADDWGVVTNPPSVTRLRWLRPGSRVLAPLPRGVGREGGAE